MRDTRNPVIFDTEQQARAQAAVLNRGAGAFYVYETGNEMGHWLITMWVEHSGEFAGYWEN